MKTFNYTITDPLGIHARPAGLLVKKCSEFECSVTIEKCGKSADAKRIFGIMGLAVKQGNEISITTDGTDEETASAEIAAFLKENL